MAGPWEKYAHDTAASATGPWDKYGGAAAETPRGPVAPIDRLPPDSPAPAMASKQSNWEKM